MKMFRTSESHEFAFQKMVCVPCCVPYQKQGLRSMRSICIPPAFRCIPCRRNALRSSVPGAYKAPERNARSEGHEARFRAHRNNNRKGLRDSKIPTQNPHLLWNKMLPPRNPPRNLKKTICSGHIREIKFSTFVATRRVASKSLSAFAFLDRSPRVRIVPARRNSSNFPDDISVH